LDTPQRLCAIDYGTKRIGLAVGDLQGGIASPLTTLTVTGGVDDQVRQIIEAADEYDVAEWVVGLPLNMDDTEGPQAKATRKFGRRLEEISGKKVHFFDERLSSLAADEYLAQAQLTRKKKKARRDRVAAQVILQTFLDAQ
jgi:putative Holliday junction resolvase